MNYGQVQAQFTSIMNRRDLTANASLVDTFCQQALTRAQRQLRVPAMEKRVDIAWDGIIYTSNTLPIPNDLIELQEITYSDSSTFRTLRMEALETVQREAKLIDHPAVFSRRGSDYLLGPTPSVGDAISVNYYAEFPALAASTDTNWLSTIAPDVIVYGALSYAADYYLDSRAPAFEARFRACIQELQDQADISELAGSAAMTPAYSYQDDCY